jgi:hypothetical protein
MDPRRNRSEGSWLAPLIWWLTALGERGGGSCRARVLWLLARLSAHRVVDDGVSTSPDIDWYSASGEGVVRTLLRFLGLVVGYDGAPVWWAGAPEFQGALRVSQFCIRGGGLVSTRLPVARSDPARYRSAAYITISLVLTTAKTESSVS